MKKFYNFSSILKNEYLKLKSNYAEDNKYLAVITNNGLWIKDNVDTNINIINASKIDQNLLFNVFITEFDENFENLSEEDEALITKSIDLIKSTNKASTSFLQRNFQIGYNKAARVMEALEQRGVVSSPNHTGKREILINSDIN